MNARFDRQEDSRISKIVQDRPAVSVIVPAYNAEATLAEAVGTALRGTHSDFEVIVVDDGSSDGTLAVADTLARADPRIRLHRQSNRGVSAAFNAGLGRARGEYVARLDSDDLWHPAKLVRQVAAARRDPQAAFIYTFVRYVDAQGRVTHDGPDQRFPRHALCRGIYESLVGANSSALMRRSAVAEIGGYDEALRSWEDLLLQLKISARADIACVPEYLVGYRVRCDSLSADPANMLRSWRQVRRQILGEFRDVPSFVHRWAHGRRCAGFAESFAWRNEYLMCARLLAEALRTDPAWTAAFLASRSARKLKRQFTGAPTFSTGPLFSDCDPLKPVWEAGETRSRLKELEAYRLGRLTKIDEHLASSANRPRSEAGPESCRREPVPL